MQASTNRATTSVGTAPELVRAAFRELHGTRLHGFALLIALGDRALAARLASEAIVAGSLRTGELRHPERAAAWLRRRVLRSAERQGRSVGRRVSADGRMALDSIGVDAAAFVGLASLTVRERAALVADAVERLDRGDVATVVGMDGLKLDRLIRGVRARYARTVATTLEAGAAFDGPTVAAIRAVAARALS